MKYKNKKSGFTILEILLALTIFAFGSVSIFILIQTMLKKSQKTRKNEIKVLQTPLIFSSNSPLLSQNTKIENQNKQIENQNKQTEKLYKIQKIEIIPVSSDLVNKKNKQKIENTYIGSKEYNQFDIQTLYSNFFIALPNKLNEDESNE